MLGQCLPSFTAVLLLSSGALASVGQTERFSIDAFNSVTRSGHVGSAEGRSMVIVGHAQTAYNASHGTVARQQEGAALIQNARAVGSGGRDIVTQQASVDGVQSQSVRSSRFGPRADGQTLTVGLETLTSHRGGVGRATSAQCVVGAQSQMQTTPNGVRASHQFVRATQFTAVSGGPCSTAKVSNNVDVSLSQGHFVGGRR
ncbi:MAG: hypothetical protein JSW66_03880 [Phycisphaerales bacterium]|nr:MAG: hypothetical protein JSW66_03880 [Phycisphaerales bacterium]